MTVSRTRHGRSRWSLAPPAPGSPDRGGHRARPPRRWHTPRAPSSRREPRLTRGVQRAAPSLYRAWEALNPERAPTGRLVAANVRASKRAARRARGDVPMRRDRAPGDRSCEPGARYDASLAAEDLGPRGECARDHPPRAWQPRVDTQASTRALWIPRRRPQRCSRATGSDQEFSPVLPACPGRRRSAPESCPRARRAGA